MNTESITSHLSTFTFNPLRYHTSLIEVREIMFDNAGTFSNEDTNGNIVIKYRTPEELQSLFIQLGSIKREVPNTAVVVSGTQRRKNNGMLELKIIAISVVISAIVLALIYCR